MDNDLQNLVENKQYQEAITYIECHPHLDINSQNDEKDTILHIASLSMEQENTPEQEACLCAFLTFILKHPHFSTESVFHYGSYLQPMETAITSKPLFLNVFLKNLANITIDTIADLVILANSKLQLREKYYKEHPTDTITAEVINDIRNNVASLHNKASEIHTSALRNLSLLTQQHQQATAATHRNAVSSLAQGARSKIGVTPVERDQKQREDEAMDEACCRCF